MHIQKRVHIKAGRAQMAGDTVTPVSLLLKLRDHYPDIVLLESNNFKSIEDCHSYIGLETIASFEVKDGDIVMRYPWQSPVMIPVSDTSVVADRLYEFLQALKPVNHEGEVDGVFGHTNFDSIRYFDTLLLDRSKRNMDLPEMRYNLYRYVIRFNHFNDQIELIEHILEGQTSKMDTLIRRIEAGRSPAHRFETVGKEQCNMDDDMFKALVLKAKEHCQMGDVFQMVLSRQYSQKYTGDDFNVYRVLRAINPSPYLFYFDYGDYKIFGSSPETQMIIDSGIARVNPIAGTYRRSGIRSIDELKTMELKTDPKENAEHIMLVDLARNDLGRHATNIVVKELKEVQYFSHVIHLVSRVEGELPEGTNPIKVFADTFPAGTLSGAPKYRAIQLIDAYEPQSRGIYGGALGYIDFDGNMNQAIIIRSFLCKNNILYYQAGAGIVVDSKPEGELQEVNNKLGALKKAIKQASKIK